MNDNLIEFHDCFESLYKSGNHKAFCLLGNYSDVCHYPFTFAMALWY